MGGIRIRGNEICATKFRGITPVHNSQESARLNTFFNARDVSGIVF